MIGEYQRRQLQQFIQITKHDDRQKTNILIHHNPCQLRIFFHNYNVIYTTRGRPAVISTNDFLFPLLYRLGHYIRRLSNRSNGTA